MKLEKQLTQSENATHICKVCFKEIKNNNFHNAFISNGVMCRTCFEKLVILDKKIEINRVKGTILYQYNDFIKEQLYKLKGCGDIELASIFLEYRKFPSMILFKNSFLIPAPSSETDNINRGFNHVIEIFKYLNLPMLPLIKKKVDFKQSDLDLNERKNIKNKLEIIDGNKITGKRVVLVDDVCTSGNTMNAMIDLVRPYKPKSIKLLLICQPKFK